MSNTIFEKISGELLDFIGRSPTCYHVTENFAALLSQNGFLSLSEADSWKLLPGKNYFVTRGGSSLIAFKVPRAPYVTVQLAAAHSDSPCFRLKENPEIPALGHYVQLNVEKYGGAILAPWLDRPLGIAGRVSVRTGNGLVHRLVDLGRDIALIPNLAIHMNRDLNNGYAYHMQSDMLPVFGMESASGRLEQLLCEVLSAATPEAPVTPDALAGSDLFLYPRTPGSIWGADSEFLSSPRLDDLQCAYALVRALIASKDPSALSAVCVFDNEEVGSLTKQGADSTFLQDTLERVNASLGYDWEHGKCAISSGFLISADNAHAAHPQHPEKADPVNRPYMNSGPVIKFSANQKYTSDGASSAVFKELCRRADVPYQIYTNHSDIAGGSTLGNLSNAHVSIHAVDIGLPQLSMHSPYETAGVKDTWYLMQVMERYFETEICCSEKGVSFR